MAQHMLTPPEIGFIDKRKRASNDSDSHNIGISVGACSKAGTTTTFSILESDVVVGGPVSGATVVDSVYVGMKVTFVDPNKNLLDNLIHTVTAKSSSTGHVTCTFTPALPVATTTSHEVRMVADHYAYADNASLDTRLAAGGYSAKNIDKMTQNDKVYAVRLLDDPKSF